MYSRTELPTVFLLVWAFCVQSAIKCPTRIQVPIKWIPSAVCYMVSIRKLCFYYTYFEMSCLAVQKPCAEDKWQSGTMVQYGGVAAAAQVVVRVN